MLGLSEGRWEQPLWAQGSLRADENFPQLASDRAERQRTAHSNVWNSTRRISRYEAANGDAVGAPGPAGAVRASQFRAYQSESHGGCRDHVKVESLEKLHPFTRELHKRPPRHSPGTPDAEKLRSCWQVSHRVVARTVTSEGTAPPPACHPLLAGDQAGGRRRVESSASGTVPSGPAHLLGRGLPGEGGRAGLSSLRPDSGEWPEPLWTCLPVCSEHQALPDDRCNTGQNRTTDTSPPKPRGAPSGPSLLGPEPSIPLSDTRVLPCLEH